MLGAPATFCKEQGLQNPNPAGVAVSRYVCVCDRHVNDIEPVAAKGGGNGGAQVFAGAGTDTQVGFARP